MNANDMLDLMNHVKDSYVMDAVASREAKRPAGMRKRNRVVLVAAVVAALLLAGCVAVLLRLQDMTIGHATFTQQFDGQGKRITPTEKTVELFTFFGHGGSPAQLAAKEWYEFTEAYDPGPLSNEANLPDIPDQYEYTYQCFTPEMVDKVDELAEKYGLKLLGTRIGIRQEQTDAALEALGISGLFRTDAQVTAGPLAGMIYPPGNFRFHVSYSLTGENAQWKTPVSAEVYYSRKDYFPLPFYQSFEQGRVRQWDYTAADGTKLLLALGDGGCGYIVADLPDAILGVQLSMNGYPAEETSVPTKAALEQLADAFDYTIQPHISDPNALLARLAEENPELPEDQKTIIYNSFDAYMVENTVVLRNYDFCSYDLNGDGKMELLLTDREDGLIHRVLLPLADGTVLEHRPWPLRLLKNGCLSNYTRTALTDRGQILIVRPYSDTCAMVLKDNGAGIETGDTILRVRWEDGGWQRISEENDQASEKTAPMTEAEVQAILDANPPMELDWQPAMQYRLRGGQTLEALLRDQDAPLSDEALTEAYAQQAAEIIRHFAYSRYCLRDINGDGVKDLLLSGDGMADMDPVSATYYWAAYTIRYGTLIKLDASSIFLCEDGVLEHYQWGPAQQGDGIQEEHEFFRLKENRRESLEKLVYFRATDCWVRGEDFTPISAAEAEQILAKYPRIDQGMCPISELME